MQGLTVLGSGSLAEAIRIGTADLTSYPPASLSAAQIVWCAYDTPIRTGGMADSDQVLEWLQSDFLSRDEKPRWVILSSQLPIGTCAHLEKHYPHHSFVVVPENLRVSHAVQDWRNQERIILGCRQQPPPPNILRLLNYFTNSIAIMSPESAEMVKHALNGFLALSVAYANEVADLSRQYGAEPLDVATGLLTDRRIGSLAYLHPGLPYGAHLDREVKTLIALGGGQLIQAINASNKAHTQEEQRGNE